METTNEPNYDNPISFRPNNGENQKLSKREKNHDDEELKQFQKTDIINRRPNKNNIVSNDIEYINWDDFKGRVADTEHFTMLIYAPRRGGKTTFINKFIKTMHKPFKKIFVFKNTTEYGSYEFKSEKITEKMTKSELDIIKLQNILKIQASLKVKKIKYPILIIFDDVLDTINKETKERLEKIAFNGRHLMVSLLFSSQTLTRFLTPAFRENMDFSIISRPHGPSSETVYNNYFRFEKTVNYQHLIKRMTKLDYSKIIVDDKKKDISLMLGKDIL